MLNHLLHILMVSKEQYISKILGVAEKSVAATIRLLDDGCTIPFISRYRKEATDGLDEVQIGDISVASDKFDEMMKRKDVIIRTIEEQGKMTPDLKNRIVQCSDSASLEDIYLPYKPKRRTRAGVARDKGLEPLAKMIMAQNEGDIWELAGHYVGDKVSGKEEALEGACDIMAEWVSEDQIARICIRQFFRFESLIVSKVIKGKEEEGDKYRDYFDWSSPLSRCPSHKLLALRRGENEGFLKVSIIIPDTDSAIEKLNSKFIKNDTASAAIVKVAIHDAFKRLLEPSIETEFAASSKAKADAEAIRVFSENLKQLLMSPPLGQKRVLAIDPGFRTGCKVVCLDAQGNLLHNETIYPHAPQNEISDAVRKLQKLVEQYKIEAISIGNGTAGRETEALVTNIRFDREVLVFSVSEDGASIYSASKLAREEFPDYDVTVRGSVSIGRRLMDPLAELVKIDPKSIGVGQYQYDVDQTELKRALDQTVMNCVNQVGVNVNTASVQLLTYVSGLGEALAQNIVNYRAANGPFQRRIDLMDVPRMGTKAFEQSAGFLRIPDSVNVLDNSGVHPESYGVVAQMACDAGCRISDLMGDSPVRKSIDLNKYVSSSVGIPTLQDIMRELEKPGRDPRKKIEAFSFDPNIRTFEDLRIGMVLPGIVTNITNFGCFVDVGIKENGLVHISEMSDKFISDPLSIISIHQQVKVRVINVDYNRGRMALSMKGVE